MTTVSELITYLQTLPPETAVHVLTEESSGYSSYCHWVNLELPTENSYESSNSMEFFSGSGKIGPFLRLGNS
jgi:hypothetical protein